MRKFRTLTVPYLERLAANAVQNRQKTGLEGVFEHPATAFASNSGHEHRNGVLLELLNCLLRAHAQLIPPRTQFIGHLTEEPLHSPRRFLTHMEV